MYIKHCTYLAAIPALELVNMLPTVLSIPVLIMSCLITFYRLKKAIKDSK